MRCPRRLVSVLRPIVVRLRISVKFSSTIVAPGSTEATICLAQDVVGVPPKRACFRRNRFRRRFAERGAAFCCEGTLQVKQLPLDRLPGSLAQKRLLAQDGGPHGAQIDPTT